MAFGKLTLIPTPIESTSVLNVEAYQLLLNASGNLEQNLFLAEDPKPARRRWIHFGLPREVIDKFVYFNEQTRNELVPQLIQELKNGKNLFLMSDAGLPAFCDPGVELINQCHLHHIQVTATPFFNSVALALALSGFQHNQFIFFGFIPRKTDEKNSFLREALSQKKTGILMDTPYRLNTLLQQILEIEHTTAIKRQYFLATELGKPEEQLIRGSISQLSRAALSLQKPEFILIFC